MDIAKEKLKQRIEEVSIEKLAAKGGFLIFLAFAGYFLVMNVLQLSAVPEYRMLNLVIQLVGLAITLKTYKSSLKDHIQYLEGLAVGFYTSLVAVLLFAVFIFIYLQVINPGLLGELRGNAPLLGKYLTPFSAAISVIAEGTVSGLILSFALMQFFKDDALHDPLKKQSDEIE